MNPKNKTKIISAFPCLGKTFFAANNKDIALDLESSDFFFDKTGFEDYSSEQFKGLSNRVKKENGLQDYLKAIDEAVKSNNYNFVFISQTPDVVKGVWLISDMMFIWLNQNPEKNQKKNLFEEQNFVRTMISGLIRQLSF